MAICETCGKHYSWFASPALVEGDIAAGMCKECFAARRAAESRGETWEPEVEKGLVAAGITVASVPTRPPEVLRPLPVIFRILAVLEFLGGVVLCYLLWPARHAEDYNHITPLVFLMAGIIFGCLFLAIAEALIYLRDIRDSLARKTN